MIAMEGNLKKFTKNVSAYIQILPRIDQCWEDIKIYEDNKKIYARSIQDFGKGKTIVNPNYWTFTTDGVLYNLQQNDIFDNIIKDSLKTAINGVDILLFSYGQTGSGKSTTINGLYNNYQNRGISPRIISELFNLQELYKIDCNIKFCVSCVEITKFCVLDLFKNNGNRKLYNPYKSLEIIKIKSEEEGIKQLFLAESQKSITYNSYTSNLLTCVFTIYIRNISRLTSNPVEKRSKIHIIDMAGIDCIGNNTCHWKKAKDVGIGNLNKSQLEHCLLAIQDDISQNKCSVKDAGILVDFLGKSLSAQSIIKFIGHIRTTREDLSISISTLRFANTARNIKSAKLKPFILQSEHMMVDKLQKDLDYLNKQIYLNAMLMNKDLSFNITEARENQMQNAIEDFIKDKSNNLSLLNVTDANIAVNMFKNICTKLAVEIIEVSKKIPSDIKLSIKSNITSKTSISTGQVLEEKISKSSKSNKSRDTQSLKKRKSFDKTSKYSKHSSQNKLNVTGSLTKSGHTFGQLMTHNFEGDVTKSLKLKAKMIQKPSIDRISEDLSKNIVSDNIKDLSGNYLQTELGDDFEETWNTYKDDKNYNFEQMNSTLNRIENATNELMTYFNSVTDKLQNKIQIIEIKKNDILRIQMFEGTNLRCASDDSINLSNAKENLAMQVVTLINESVDIKEELLKLQSEIKINIDEYHRTKNNITKDFTQYCTDTSKIRMPSTEQIIECIEDKINDANATSINSEDLKEQIKEKIFFRCQSEMKKIKQKFSKQLKYT